jgi:anti-anti-sigma factor
LNGQPATWIVALTGEHDLYNARDLEETLAETLTTGEPVIVDLTATTFAESATLGAIISATTCAEMQGLAIVLPEDGPVARVFDLVHASAVLPTFHDLDAARRWVARPSPPADAAANRAGRQ